jgi:hypothetical protein
MYLDQNVLDDSLTMDRGKNVAALNLSDNAQAPGDNITDDGRSG